MDENIQETQESFFIEKQDLYIALTFFMIGGIFFTFVQGEDVIKPMAFAVAITAGVVGILNAIASPTKNNILYRILKCFFIIIWSVVMALFGGALHAVVMPITLAIILWIIRWETPEPHTAEEHKQNIVALNVAYLVVSIMLLYVLFRTPMFKASEIAGWISSFSKDGELSVLEKIGYGVASCVAPVAYKLSGSFDELEFLTKSMSVVITFLFVIIPVFTTILTFTFSKKRSVDALTIILIPPYVILGLVVIDSLIMETEVHDVAIVLDNGFHIYFVMSHVAAIIALCRSKQSKLLGMLDE